MEAGAIPPVFASGMTAAVQPFHAHDRSRRDNSPPMTDTTGVRVAAGKFALPGLGEMGAMLRRAVLVICTLCCGVPTGCCIIRGTCLIRMNLRPGDA